MSDGPQALLPEQYAELMGQIRKLAELFGKKFGNAGSKGVGCISTRHARVADIEYACISWNSCTLLKRKTDETSVRCRQLEDEPRPRRLWSWRLGWRQRPASMEHVDIGVCPPSVYLDAVKRTRRSSIGLGAQNMYHEAQGRVHRRSRPAMLVDMGCKYVILGHSERRHIFKETDEDVNQEVRSPPSPRADADRLRRRAAGRARSRQDQAVIQRQFDGSLAGLTARTGRQDRHRLRAGLGHWHRESRHARAGRGGPCRPSQVAAERYNAGTLQRVSASCTAAA